MLMVKKARLALTERFVKEANERKGRKAGFSFLFYFSFFYFVSRVRSLANDCRSSQSLPPSLALPPSLSLSLSRALEKVVVVVSRVGVDKRPSWLWCCSCGASSRTPPYLSFRAQTLHRP
ncbi:hypothetical protein IE53DRAFT_149833 [Violaceomyces palustris]|uniref:Uncharacterized protein n=1 Tax=Violaceomyces palustris TaxID=1673888 RepID=A0ACD0NU31_9BASI|nr:hypothetical protein IE53DRAFT_149833 [Violaceomyces palustris]